MNIVKEVIVFICLIFGSRGQWLDENCGSGGSTSSPWLATIYIWDLQKWNNYFHSSGTLITDHFILTHAIPNAKPGFITVRLGATYDSSPASRWYYIESLIIHPNFENNGNQIKNDIALIKLTQKVDFNAHIRPICMFYSRSKKQELLQRQVADSNLELTFTSWHERYIYAKRLKSVRVFRLDPEFCSTLLKIPLEQNQICGYTEFNDLCFRNSGGPLEKVINKWGKNESILLGIQSYGTGSCGDPEVFTDIVSHSEWISGIVRAHKCLLGHGSVINILCCCFIFCPDNDNDDDYEKAVYQ
ncbi:phenoloxidase-activating factor 3-like [Drosophila subpulchrella]|uniref:phenoloxidase-activating factor 3-like n=1 Tax=Drosophila subpulchrella TaxID=1486046 RepID=UPI0018A14749|nr:phenoloxidase-activating factor 3-like [Drosophila subpulchrella]